MSEIDLEGIRERRRGIDPSPWHADQDCSDEPISDLIVDSTGAEIAAVFGYLNQTFVANAPCDIDALIAEIDRLRKIEAALGSIGFLNTVYRLLKNGHATIVREERLAFEGLLEAIAPSNVDGADGSERVVELEGKS